MLEQAKCYKSESLDARYRPAGHLRLTRSKGRDHCSVCWWETYVTNVEQNKQLTAELFSLQECKSLVLCAAFIGVSLFVQLL